MLTVLLSAFAGMTFFFGISYRRGILIIKERGSNNFMELLITVFGAILAVFIVIVLHEAGHFLVAKILGVKVLRFSVGFGKAIWSYQSRRSGTEYVIAILPLGGYVKMLDDRELQVSYQESKMAYNRQPLLTRMAIVLAGPLTNFLLAIIAFWMVFLLGISYIKPVIGKVLPDSIAVQAGLKAGDDIKAIDGQKVYEWQQVFTDIIGRIGNKEDLSLTVQPADSAALQTRYLSLVNWKLVGNQPDILKSLGIVPYRPEFPAIVSKILPNSPAAIKGLQKNDQLIAINGKSMTEWPDLMDYIKNHPHQEITLTIQRDKSQQQVTVELGSKQQNGQNTGFPWGRGEITQLASRDDSNSKILNIFSLASRDKSNLEPNRLQLYCFREDDSWQDFCRNFGRAYHYFPHGGGCFTAGVAGLSKLYCIY